MTPDEATETIAENAKLRAQLIRARDLLKEQKEEIDKLCAPPNNTAVYLRRHGGDKALISIGGRETLVTNGLESDVTQPVSGDIVVLNESMVIIEILRHPVTGEVGVIDHFLDDGRAFVIGDSDQSLVLGLGPLSVTDVKIGDTVVIDSKARLIRSIVAGADKTEELVLEEVPDISYDDIGGLDSQLQEIHDSIELPYLHPDLFKKYHRKAPKGILLYGPPGCGKTLVAKAVANSLAHKTGAGKAYFLNIKGPELLNKWVGETERALRDIFRMARAKASDGFPVIIFFDEMDSMFRQRGSGVSSDVESTIVPQMLAEMDGVEELHNVIIVGASNRQDLIDPALLRPGRLDVKIAVGRPDKEGARNILAKYLTADLPYRDNTSVAFLADKVTDFMYREDKETEFLEVVYVNGVKEMLHFKDFTSGAMLASVVDRAKTKAIKDELAGIGEGITLEHLLASVAEEFKENEDLPNTTNPDDWAKISGKKGERIASVRPVLRENKDTPATVVIDVGQYL
jgi:proteasome-associated ATPase